MTVGGGDVLGKQLLAYYDHTRSVCLDRQIPGKTGLEESANVTKPGKLLFIDNMPDAPAKYLVMQQG